MNVKRGVLEEMLSPTDDDVTTNATAKQNQNKTKYPSIIIKPPETNLSNLKFLGPKT